MAETWGQQHKRRQMERGTPVTARQKRAARHSKVGMEKTCPQCKGSGQMPQVRLFRTSGRGTCSRCGGSGRVDA